MSAQEWPYGYGYCCCGCGQKTNIAPYTARTRGIIKGQPMRFLQHHSNRSGTIEQRFWRHVQRGKPDECWEWQAWKNNKGYGMVGSGVPRPKLLLSHRVSWEIHNGPIPENLNVLHSCDNPACCNPNHLSLGTHTQNMADMYEKGRDNHAKNARGEYHGNAKLTAEKVREIRELGRQGMLQREIGKLYGIGQVHVGEILRRVSWKHVP